MSGSTLHFLGVSKSDLGKVTLPFDLKSIVAPGCLLLTSPDIIVAALTDGQGNSSVNLPVPDNGSMVGKQLYSQFMVYDPGANNLNLVASSAAALLVGK